MNRDSRSAGALFRSTAWMAAATVVSSLAAVVRLKIFAVLLGPAGLGLLAVLQSLTSALVTLADFGIGGATTREIARVEDDKARAARVRRTAVLLTLILGTAGAALLTLFRRRLAFLALGDAEQGALVAALALAVPASSVAGAYFGVLGAHRLVRRNAIARIIAAFAGSAAAVTLVWRLGSRGLPWAIVSLQLALLAAAWLLAPSVQRITASWRELARDAKPLVTVGAAAVVATVGTAVMDLVARSYLARRLGLDAAGEFQAAWAVSMLVTGLALAALAVDYFPRVSSAAARGGRLAALFSPQASFSLSVALPALLAIGVFSDSVVRVLYSADFAVAPSILRWQVTGDALRIVCWIQATTLLAVGRLGVYLFHQLLWNASYLAWLVFVVQHHGLEWSGVALALSYLPILFFQALALRHELPGAALATPALLLGAGFTALASLAAIEEWLPAGRLPARVVAVVFALALLWRLFRRLRGDLGGGPGE